MKSVPIRVSVLLLCAVFALCLYRAATQSLTIDEAFTFLHYVDTPWRSVFGEYSANNHVLFSLVSRIFRYKFGRSEIVLRIPTLIGCLLYLMASFRICRQAIGDRWVLPLGVAALTLNPLLLDFLVAARGYGLALGLFWWAVYFVWTDKLWRAGVLAGFCIATNLTFLVPLAALGAIAILLHIRKGRFWEPIYSYGVPAILISFTILIVPLTKSAGQFYYGAATLSDTISSLVNESFPGEPNVLSRQVLPPLFVAGLAVGLWLLWKGKSAHAELAVLVLGTLGLCILCWIAMHRLLNFVYPLNRTALYIIPLATLAVVLGTVGTPWRFASSTIALILAGISSLYIAQIRTGYFNEWKGEAGMNRLVRRLGDDAAITRGSREVTAGGTWFFEYSMRYYSKRHRLPWLKVLDAGERERSRPDYYIFSREEAARIEELKLKVIDTDAFSGTILARSY